MLRGIGALPPEDRPRVGAVANAVRTAIEAALAERGTVLRGSALTDRLAAEATDVTTPGRPIRRGTLHPINTTIEAIAEVFGQFGFVVYEAPEIEDDVRNFQMLNIPPDHPARDLWDTLYVDVEGQLLRTHTSPGQIRVMHESAPPIRALLPGRMLPLRGDRREPRLGVLPGRGPDGRRGDHDGRPARASSTSSRRRCTAPTSGPASARATTRSPSRPSRSTWSAWSAAASAARPARGAAG